MSTRRSVLVTIVLSVALAAFGSDARAADVAFPRNGDFERPAIDEPFQWFFSPTRFAGWRVAFGAVDLIASYWKAESGVQSVELNGSERGGIRRTVPTVAEERYVLRFALAANPSPVCGPLEPRTMVVRFAGARVGRFTFDPAGHTIEDMGWRTETLHVTATDARSRMAFRSKEDGCAGAAIDHVRFHLER